MAHVNCPKCDKRLRAPDSPRPITLRCPTCKHVFDSPSGDSQPAEAQIARELDDLPMAAPDDVDDGPATDATGDSARIFSDADEAMLRTFGSGSGLLELTRETYELSLGDVNEEAAKGDPKDATMAAAVVEHPDRQFSVVATALTLANKLVLTHKTDAARTRKNARLAWALVATIALVCMVELWWGTKQAGSADLERSNAKNFSERFNDAQQDKGVLPKLAQQLDASDKERRSLRDKMDGLQKVLDDTRKSEQTLSARLGTADAKLVAMSAELDRFRATSRPATGPADTALTHK